MRAMVVGDVRSRTGLREWGAALGRRFASARRIG